MIPAEFYRARLNQSADELVFTAKQIPTGRWYVTPLPAFGEWPVAKLVYHVGWSDRHTLLPQLKQWLGAEKPDLSGDDVPREGDSWIEASKRDIDDLLAEMRASRDKIVALIDQFSDELWEETRETVWGEVTLDWMCLRVYAHTVEHTSNLLNMALFWDLHLEQMEKQRREG